MKASTKRGLIIAGIAIAGFIVITGGTFALLSFISKNDSSKPVPELSSKDPMSNELVTTLSEQVNDGKLLAANGFSLTNKAQAPVPSETLGVIDITTDNAAQFSPVEPIAQEVASTYLTQLDSYFTGKGLMKMSNPEPASKNSVYYQNVNTICVVQPFVSPEGVTVSIQVPCISKDAVIAESNTLETLFKAWGNDTRAPYITRQEVKNDKGSASQVTLLEEKNGSYTATHKLIFAKDGSKDWQFIDDTSTSAPVEQNEKYAITAKVKTALSGQPYSQALQELIEGRKS
jgi:hypothetical protein